jgi:tRNA(Ile)-lysidine synthase
MHEMMVPTGKYVVAVSGGVDSMVLLDMLQRLPHVQLVVAHYDHGIRSDSAQDAELVAVAAKRAGLPFAIGRGKLGAGASEAAARTARYAFLRQVQADHQAAAIITAHHQDDVLETAIINMVRGTGRKGLSSLTSRAGMMRPLLAVNKQTLRAYAAAHPAIRWREDSTNNDQTYLRNYIRHTILPRLDDHARQQLLGHIARAARLNPQIDQQLQLLLVAYSDAAGLQRAWFIGLSYVVSCEVMAAWLRQHGIRDFNRRQISDLVVAAKTARPGTYHDIDAGHWLEATKTTVRITPRVTS